MKYRYKLELYKGMNSRYTCPSCNVKSAFTRYIDANSQKHIHPTVGMCRRKDKCNYHYPPKQYFQDSGIAKDSTILKDYNRSNNYSEPRPTSFISQKVFQDSLLNGLKIDKIVSQNNLVPSLIGLFRHNIASELIQKYSIGTSGHWHGATVFWQIDLTGRVRTGKIMLYNRLTGKRVKQPFDHFNWVHTTLSETNFELKQCLFGEHLLHDKTKPVAVVESEKTAIIASGYIPEFIWVATGGLNGLTEERCSVLKNRDVILFPDLGKGYTEWEKKAKELSHITQFRISNLLKRLAKEEDVKKGLDVADFLGRLDYLEFILFDSKEV